eukprot:TRINITY_DN2915_c0_g1_i11.p3 TRINITY_DN2915_c0_g1~~TRINITY_DN2915_c0_g1_i11.p3  ORF type:complete len:233 (-),score=17.97 TRINITY_DN2915_c0_g1_i11:1880-2578(-)
MAVVDHSSGQAEQRRTEVRLPFDFLPPGVLGTILSKNPRCCRLVSKYIKQETDNMIGRVSPKDLDQVLIRKMAQRFPNITHLDLTKLHHQLIYNRFLFRKKVKYSELQLLTDQCHSLRRIEIKADHLERIKDLLFLDKKVAVSERRHLYEISLLDAKDQHVSYIFSLMDATTAIRQLKVKCTCQFFTAQRIAEKVNNFQKFDIEWEVMLVGWFGRLERYSMANQLQADAHRD